MATLSSERRPAIGYSDSLEGEARAINAAQLTRQESGVRRISSAL